MQQKRRASELPFRASVFIPSSRFGARSGSGEAGASSEAAGRNEARPLRSQMQTVHPASAAAL